MNSKFNKYKEYRNHKINLINRRLLKCYSIINNFQKGGMELNIIEKNQESDKSTNVSIGEIDNMHKTIYSKLYELGKNLNQYRFVYNEGIKKMEDINDKLKKIMQ